MTVPIPQSLFPQFILDAFVVGTDGHIYTAAWGPTFTDGWHGWWELNEGRAAPGAPVTAVSRSADKSRCICDRK
ncbi:MAG: hypothetical protein J5U17_06735 [Candidatus Methanoperedens sp.]|nr:hypothetical protein [Candidatus Methanoperedens sp.]MCE8425459.1 hypothetical protein [Candidatus Methanoperedens sp.]MCE8428613.1 hypothetical protein [Candidatus Methanoperedens sp.]